MTKFLKKYMEDNDFLESDFNKDTLMHLRALQNMNDERLEEIEKNLKNELEAFKEYNNKLEKEADSSKQLIKILKQDLDIVDSEFYKVVEGHDDVRFECEKGCGSKVPLLKKVFREGWQRRSLWVDEE